MQNFCLHCCLNIILLCTDAQDCDSDIILCGTTGFEQFLTSMVLDPDSPCAATDTKQLKNETECTGLSFNSRTSLGHQLKTTPT